MHNIIFDLDGTLTDSGEGIIKCAALALKHFGLPVPSREEMRVFIGPPLRETFQKFGIPTEQVEEAVRIYRSRYVPIGMFENTPYPGIQAMLASLKSDGYSLYVATSKPEDMAVEILKKFKLASYFELICGATLDGKRDSKESVIGHLLKQLNIQQDAIMIGDTAYDVIGAAAHGIKTIGVSWGYGAVEEITKAGAFKIAHSPKELIALIHEVYVQA